MVDLPLFAGMLPGNVPIGPYTVFFDIVGPDGKKVGSGHSAFLISPP